MPGFASKRATGAYLLRNPRRNARLQFFEPVLRNDDFLSRRLLAGAH